MLNRRRLLQGSAALAFAGLGRAAFAQEQPAVPIVFVHGDSDLAATWETQIWRFESNGGYPRDRLFAISFTDPRARDDDSVAQPNRSSTQDQLRELTAFIDEVKAKTGAPKVATVALSRGGYATREYAAAAWHTTLRLPALEDRPIIGEFNEERIVARPWPANQGHMTILELTG
jgi:pimeloyl-ACP methyl ester carboxylesterase